MENKDIIGKIIKGFEFKDMARLSYSGLQRSNLGKDLTVTSVHPAYPEYCRVINEDGKSCHYPTEEVIKQILENEPVIDLEKLFDEIKKL